MRLNKLIAEISLFKKIWYLPGNMTACHIPNNTIVTVHLERTALFIFIFRFWFWHHKVLITLNHWNSVRTRMSFSKTVPRERSKEDAENKPHRREKTFTKANTLFRTSSREAAEQPSSQRSGQGCSECGVGENCGGARLPLTIVVWWGEEYFRDQGGDEITWGIEEVFCDLVHLKWHAKKFYRKASLKIMEI